MTKYYKHTFRNGKSIRPLQKLPSLAGETPTPQELLEKSIGFFSNPLNTSSQCHLPKYVDAHLAEILLDPEKFKAVYPSQFGKKIFIGFGTFQPFSTYRFPIWINPEILFQHMLIGGSIGSGKSTLITRLIAGSLNCGMTAVIGEAKGSLEINPQRTAFSRLALYLARRLQVHSYRWPRGNCYFNPLLYLGKLSDRQTFMQSIADQIKAEGEMKSYVDNAARMAAYILELLETISVTESREKICTLRHLLDLLKHPEDLEKVVEHALKTFPDTSIKAKINRLVSELERLNFFSLKTAAGRDRFVMTCNGINFFAQMLEEEDLLFYSEPHTQDRHGNPLIKLELDDIVYNRALVVISQPLALNHPSANIVGPIFWDALLNYTLQLGITPTVKNGKKRQDIAVFLDETHHLPTGRMGNSGDFLRHYKIGLVEITPAIVDKERWEKNKHVYQTIISTSPGVPEVCNLIRDRLPEQDKERFEIGIGLQLNNQGKIELSPKLSDRSEQHFNYDNPGVSARSLQNTGKYTALLYSYPIKPGLFWIDLESTILSQLDNLLEDANDGDQTAAKVIDYALGLTQEFVP